MLGMLLLILLFNNNNNKPQLGYHLVAVVILHVHKYGGGGK
jgi:hypothetical protein